MPIKLQSVMIVIDLLAIVVLGLIDMRDDVQVVYPDTSIIIIVVIIVIITCIQYILRFFFRICHSIKILFEKKREKFQIRVRSRVVVEIHRSNNKNSNDF